jgi:phosphinothricin acetyltransferase
MAATIRLASNDDAAQIAAIYAPSCESTSVSFEVVAPSPEEIPDRIRTISAHFPWLVVDDGGSIAGYAYASRHRDRAAYGWAVDTAVYVSESHRRSGVGRALYTTLFQLLRLQGYFKAYAGITLPNRASTGLHEAVGFTLVGVYRGVGYKHDVWHDVAWYGIPLQPERLNPGPPVAVSTLVGSPAWTEAVSRGLVHYRPASRPAR